MKDYVEHTVTHIVDAGWSRVGTMTRPYVSIAFDNYAEHKCAEAKRLSKPLNDQDPTAYQEREKAYTRSALTSIVFAGLAVEAAIYEIAATHLTDKFTQDHLDRMDVFTKWALVPRLICGKALDPGGPGMNMLDELIQVRNLLVHHKSKPLPNIGSWRESDTGCSVVYDDDSRKVLEATFKKIDAETKRIIDCATNGVRAIVCLSLELEDLLGIAVPVLGCYRPGWVSSEGEPPASIRQLIADCRRRVAVRRSKVQTR